ncbi:hypothetical protein AURDEDRAFT_124275 [Auricularia subglabra TFB-10046 SS5]|nr:hypothetical protein AURDEDRAFT_124275 [Auricularia subglabra TFB-10046 SS5]
MVVVLNDDVLEAIVRYVNRSTLPAVCLASRSLEHIGRRKLYEHICVRAEQAFALFYTFIYARPTVGRLVRSYTELTSLNNVVIPAWSVERFRMLSQALVTMINVRNLRLRTPVRDIISAGRGDDFSNAISGMRALTVLMVHSVPGACGTLFSGITANLTCIAVQGLANENDGPPSGLTELLRACRYSLTRVRLSTMDLSQVLKLRDEDEAVWPNVILLDIAFCSADARLARAFPALRTLVARDSIMPVAGLLCAPGAWPHLHTLDLSHDFDVLEDAELPTPRVLDTFRVLEGRDAMFAGPHYEHLQDVLSVVVCETLRHLTVYAMPWTTRAAQKLAAMCFRLESLSVHFDGVHAISMRNLFDGLHALKKLRRFGIVYRNLRNYSADHEGLSLEVYHLGCRVVPSLREVRMTSLSRDPPQCIHWLWHRRHDACAHWVFQSLPYEYIEEDVWLD